MPSVPAVRAPHHPLIERSSSIAEGTKAPHVGAFFRRSLPPGDDQPTRAFRTSRLARQNPRYAVSLRAVIGRDDELAALEAFLVEVGRGPAALAISGEAGIGKTVLWEAAVERAGPPVGRVLSYRAAEPESQL